MATPAVKASFLAAGSIRVGNTPEEFAAFIQTETVKWATIIKASGATAD